MTLFQIVALIVLAIALVATFAAAAKGSISRRDGAFWMILWIAAGVAITWPRITVRVAKVLGIGRGADLVLYCAVVVMMIGFLMVYARLRRLRRQLTLMTRHLAIRDAVTNTQATRPSSGEESS